jgi:hypothetical protein
MKCETARARGGRMLRESGYKHHADEPEDRKMIEKAVHQHDGQLHSEHGSHVGRTKLKLNRGGKVKGAHPKERVDRRARGGHVKGHGKTIINVNAGGEQGGQQQAAMAHQQGMQQGIQMGARAAAQKLAGGAPGGPPGGGAPPPRPPMMPPQGGGMPPPGMMPPGGAPPGAMPPRPMPPPGPMARGGKVTRRDEHGRFLGGAL